MSEIVDIRFLINGSEVEREASRTRVAISGVDKQTRMTEDSMRSLARYATRMVGAVSFGAFVKELINVRSEFQNFEAQFKVFLGDADKAKSFLKEMQGYAFNNVFEFKDLTKQAAQLLAFRHELEDIIPIIDRLSNIAAGANVPLEQLVELYNKAKSQGRLMKEDIQQWQRAGVPLIAELAKQFNVTEQAMWSMVTKGKVGFSEVEAVIGRLTSEGGMFAGMMQEKMKNLGDSVGLLEDSLTNMFNKIGESSQEFLRSGIMAANFLVEHYAEIGRILGVLIAGYGAYKAAVVAVTVAQRLQVAAGSIRAFYDLARGIKSARDAQVLLNLAVGANPLIKIASVLATAIGLIWAFGRNAKDAARELGELERKVMDEGRQVNTLVAQLTNANTKEEERRKILGQLRDIQPKLVEGIDAEALAVEGLTAKLKLYNEEQVKRAAYAKLQDDVGGITAELNTARTNQTLAEAEGIRAINGLREQIQGSSMKAKDYYLKIVDDIVTSEGDIQSKLERISREFVTSKGTVVGRFDMSGIHSAWNELFGLGNEITKLEAGAGEAQQKVDDFMATFRQFFEPGKVDAGNVVENVTQLKEIVGEIKEYEAQIAALAGKGEWNETEETSLKNMRESLDLVKTRYKELTGKDYDQHGKDVLKGQDTLDKALLDAEITLWQSRIDVMKDGREKEQAELELRHKQTLANIERDKKTLLDANKQTGTPKLTNDQQAALTERRVNADKALEEDTKKLNKRYADETAEVYDQLADVFLSQEERKQKEIRKTYTELRKWAKEALEGGSITQGDYTGLTGMIDQSEQQAIIADSLEKYKTYGDRVKAITEQYQAEIKALEAAGYNEQAEEARLQMQEALETLDLEIANKETSFTVWLEGVTNMGLKRLRQSLETAKLALEGNSKLTDKERAVLRAKIATLQKQIETLSAREDSKSPAEKTKKKWDDTLKIMNEVSQTVSNITSSFDSLDDITRTALTSAVSVAGGIIAMITGIQQLGMAGAKAIKGVERASVILAVIGTAMQILSTIFSLSSKADKEHQEALRKIAEEKISMQREYNKLLLEQKLLMQEAESAFGGDQIVKAAGALDVYREALDLFSAALKGESPTMTSWERTLGDIFGTYAKRLEEYNQGIGGLSGIKVKTGSHTTGAWFWKKQHDTYTDILKLYPDLIDGENNLNIGRVKSILSSHKLSDADRERLQYLVDMYDKAEEALGEFDAYIENTFGSLGDSIMDSIVNAIANGADAWTDFGKAGASVLEDLGRQIAYTLFFSDKFKDLQSQLQGIYGSGKDPKDIANDARNLMASFYQGISGDMTAAQQWLEEWQAQAKKQGFDLWADEEATQSGVSGQLQAAMTEKTGTELVGLWNMTAMDTREIKQHIAGSAEHTRLVQIDVRQIMATAVEIAANTKQTAENTAGTNERLDRMQQTLNTISENTNTTASRR